MIEACFPSCLCRDPLFQRHMHLSAQSNKLIASFPESIDFGGPMFPSRWCSAVVTYDSELSASANSDDTEVKAASKRLSLILVAADNSEIG